MISITMRIAWMALAAGATLAATAPVAAQGAPTRAANEAAIQEELAKSIGTIAYIWGYPIVDLTRQMHNETHRVAADQQTYAPVNFFYRFDHIVTPSNAGNLRAPNNDTLYYGGWFDLRKEPVIIHVPDTAGRYYTLAIMDFYGGTRHVGRRATGTAERYFALVGPSFSGSLPADVTPITVPTHNAWILGRMYVAGESDLPAARHLLQGFWAAPLSTWRRDVPPAEPPPIAAPPLARGPVLEFYTLLNRWLRENEVAAGEAGLMTLFDQAGFGPKSEFDPGKLTEAQRRGLERALADGERVMRATQNMSMPDVRNGWVFPLDLGRAGSDYLLRASVAVNGYANLPEEAVYVTAVADSEGRNLSGSRRYALHIRPDEMPPAGAFWSLIPYDLRTAALIENPLRRYSLGDRTPGVKRNRDGSLDIYIQKDAPREGPSNWLPVGEGDFLLVLRIYQPGPTVFDGSFRFTPLRIRPDSPGANPGH